jgi:hypothetical protein
MEAKQEDKSLGVSLAEDEDLLSFDGGASSPKKRLVPQNTQSQNTQSRYQSAGDTDGGRSPDQSSDGGPLSPVSQYSLTAASEEKLSFQEGLTRNRGANTGPRSGGGGGGGYNNINNISSRTGSPEYQTRNAANSGKL